MDLLSDAAEYSGIERVVFMKSTQVGATEVLNNWVGYTIDRLRVPMMVTEPTIEMAERWSKQRLASMIEDTDCLREKIAPARARDSGNTTLLKEWPGGVLIISGANSAASLRSMPARFLAADEVDAYPVELENEGDPLSLAEARLDAFDGRRKVFVCSTPTIKSLSVIDREYALSDQRRYHVPCPHCGHRQTLAWEQLHWPDNHPERAAYLCEGCGEAIQEHHKTAMLAGGEWVADRPDQLGYAAGFAINALYTPIGLGRSWGALAEEWSRKKTDPVKIKTFTNTRLGICTEDPEEKIDWEEVKHAAEPYALRTIPERCLVLTAGVDVQGDRWECQIIGHGWDDGWVQWVIDYQVIDGDPLHRAHWQRIDDYLMEPITNAAGVPMRVRSACVDAGYLQDDVIQFTHPRTARGIHAIKGASTKGRPIIGRPTKVDLRTSGSTIRHGSQVWLVGEDTGKARLFQTIIQDRKAPSPASRRLHFSGDLDDSYYAGLTAEIYDPNKRRWIKIRNRNEPLDTYVYALAAAMMPRVRLHKWSAEQWDRERAMIMPALDLFSAAGVESPQPPGAPPPQPTQQPTQPQPQRPRPRSNFVTGFRR
jgi:phage terminase large subunit GpA-like protein